MVSITRSFSAAAMVSMLFASAWACSNDESCKTGCAHLLELAKKEIDTRPIPDSLKKTLHEDAQKSAAADLDTCVAKCKRGEIDGSCLGKLEQFQGAATCKK